MNSMNTVNIVNAADDAGGLKENKRKKEFVFSGNLPIDVLFVDTE